MNSDKHRVFGLGTIVVDHHVVVEGLPEHDAKGEAESVRYQVGGPVPTALCLLRRLGIDVTFQGMWADDHHGRMIEDHLESEGIAYARPDAPPEGESGFAHVWVERGTGRRTIVAHRGSHAVEPEHLNDEHIADHHALHLDGWSGEAAIVAAESIRAGGGTVFMDLGSPKPEFERLLAAVDVLNCPARLIPRLFGYEDLEKGARELIAMGPREVTVTSGEEGALLVPGDGDALHQPAFELNAVDTNGAGDVFAGAMIYGALLEWPLEQKLRFASAAAAIKCQKIGNRDALPEMGEIEALLNG